MSETTEDYILHGNPTPQEVLDFYDLHTADGASNFSHADGGFTILLWHSLAQALAENATLEAKIVLLSKDYSALCTN